MTARLLQYFPELVAQLGGDPAALLNDAGIEEPQLRPEQPVTYRQLVNAIELAAETLKCPDFGLRLGALQGSKIYGPLGLLMKNSRTFGEALQHASRYCFIHSGVARMWLQPQGDGMVFIAYDILLDRISTRRHAVEQILLIGQLGALELTGGAARARKVHFRHAPIASPATYHRHFRCPVLFHQAADGLFFSDADMAAPVLGHDTAAQQQAISFIEGRFRRNPPPVKPRVRGLIMQLLSSGDCLNARIAAELNLHERKLRRLLAAEGTTFQTIKDEVRRDAMLHLIQHTRLEFSAISERLGFAEPSVLSRHCRGWFAKSPTELRAEALSPTISTGSPAPAPRHSDISPCAD